jgi:predicted transcriptional regulator
MSTLSLRLPDSLHQKVKELAARDDISINQFIAIAVAEKMSALLTVEYLEERAARGDRAAFERVLKRVPARKPIAGDEWLPSDGAKPQTREQPLQAERRRKSRRRRA